jgi:CubicO group peptidase (beta-lactamase class C family)
MRCVAVLLMLGVSIASAAEFSQLDAVVKSSAELYGFKATAIAVVSKEQQIIMRGYGRRQWDRPELVDTQTLFPIYSTTKVFLGLAAARLIQDEKLRYADTVRSHLPEFRVLDEALSRQITFGDTLAHGMGVGNFDDWLENVPFLESSAAMPRLALAPQVAPLGQVHYTGSETIVAASVLEKITQIPWNAYVAQAVLQPLSLSRTFMRAGEFIPAQHIAPTADGWVAGIRYGADALEKVLNVAPPHGQWPGSLEYLANDPRELRNRLLPFQKSAIDPAQSAFTSIQDMVVIMQMLLAQGQARGQQFLERDLLKDMIRPHAFEASDEPWGHANGATQDWADAAYGTPFALVRILGQECFGHTGGSLGAESYLFICPGIDLGVFAVTTGSLYLSGGLQHIVKHIVGERLGRPSLPIKDPSYAARVQELIESKSAFAAEIASLRGNTTLTPQSYEGDYFNPYSGVLKIRQCGAQLFATLGRGASWELQVLSDTALLATWVGPRRLSKIVHVDIDLTKNVRRLRFVDAGLGFDLLRAGPGEESHDCALLNADAAG